MKTTPEPLPNSDQTEIIKTLTSDGMGSVLRVVSGLMESQLASAALSMLAADAFPQRVEEAGKSFDKARRYRHFLEVYEELKMIAQDNDEQFCSVKIVPTEVREVTAMMESSQ